MDERQREILSLYTTLAVMAVLARLGLVDDQGLGEDLHAIIYHAVCRGALEVANEPTACG